MSSQIELLTQIPKSEEKSFKELIKAYRYKYIKSPSEHVREAFLLEQEALENVLVNKKVSEVIHILREQAYNIFLKNEAEFNKVIITDLCDTLATPKKIIDTIISEGLPSFQAKKESFEAGIKRICGEYAGYISPYIYQISLSNTQSRRSRAGKTFEAIIYKLYEAYGYEFASQRQIGKKTFADKGLGKMVDSLLPHVEAFEQRRDKVVIGTMKTTLRERWQEVVEEVSRTGLPKIYLLTMDEDLSETKVQQMGKHNIVLVVPEWVKKQDKLVKYRNVISFEDYFTEEIPDVLKYWKNV
jgi:hypothetical protein